ncbi:MAG TPA: iron uptake system protein EfeO [Gaiellaceae bacterium]|nr:iron uptake system protein EfeO [Gaiellaceae bacterium]
MTLRSGLLAATAVAASLALPGCGGGGDKSAASGRTVEVTLTDAGCKPERLRLAAGPVTFAVENDGAEAVSEFEVLDGDRILGEVENVAPGLSGRFSLTLKPGRFTMYCPGGDTERGALVVTGAAAGQTAGAKAAAARYGRYVEAQTALLVSRTRTFVRALAAGDIAASKRAYAAARIPYEAIEPVAESFGGLDPAIDAREGDVPASRWTGFHPIEQALWVRGTAGSARLRTKLMHDVVELQRRVRTIDLEPAQIANGSVELLGEVSKSKITGEEERYSHLDLVDVEANVDGARAAFDAVSAMVASADPGLATRIEARFAGVDRALRPYRRGDSFVSYPTLTEQDTRALSRSIDALAEPLSRVGAIVAGR